VCNFLLHAAVNTYLNWSVLDVYSSVFSAAVVWYSGVLGKIQSALHLNTSTDALLSIVLCLYVIFTCWHSASRLINLVISVRLLMMMVLVLVLVLVLVEMMIRMTALLVLLPLLCHQSSG